MGPIVGLLIIVVDVLIVRREYDDNGADDKRGRDGEIEIDDNSWSLLSSLYLFRSRLSISCLGSMFSLQ